MIVKVCGITNTEDALAAAEAGATAIGFNFYPKSPRYLAVGDARSIAQSLPAAILKVGVFVNEPMEAIDAIAREVALDVVQIHGNSLPLPHGWRVWQAFRADRTTLTADVNAWPAEAFLIDTPSPTLHGGTGESFDWSLLTRLNGRVILAGGLDDANVGEAIRRAMPWGVDACSRLECAPGKKDHDKMRRFIRAAMAKPL